MRKIIIAAALSLMASQASAQDSGTQASDSVVIIESRNVTIKKNGSIVGQESVTVTSKRKRSETEYASSHNDTIYISTNSEKSENNGLFLTFQKDKNNFRHHLEGIFLGACNYVDADGQIKPPASAPWLKLNDGRSLSFDIYWEPIKLPAISKHFAIEIGYDLEFNHYSLGKDFRLEMKDGAMFADYQDVPDGGFKRQNLRVAYFGVPLVAELQLGESRQFYLTAGIKGQLRCPTRTKMIWKEDGNRMKDKVKDDFNTRFLRASIIGGIGCGSWQIFGTYSPMGLFKDGMGPEIYPFSIGIKIN